MTFDALVAGFFMRGRMAGMKAISASIVVMAGAVLFSVGQMLNHPDSGMVTCIAGAAVGIIGLVGWYRAMIAKSE